MNAVLVKSNKVTPQESAQDNESLAPKGSLKVHDACPVESHRASDRYGARGPSVFPDRSSHNVVSPAMAAVGPNATRSPASHA